MNLKPSTYSFIAAIVGFLGTISLCAYSWFNPSFSTTYNAACCGAIFGIYFVRYYEEKIKEIKPSSKEITKPSSKNKSFADYKKGDLVEVLTKTEDQDLKWVRGRITSKSVTSDLHYSGYWVEILDGCVIKTNILVGPERIRLPSPCA